jgi:hypothetical protein
VPRSGFAPGEHGTRQPFGRPQQTPAQSGGESHEFAFPRRGLLALGVLAWAAAAPASAQNKPIRIGVPAALQLQAGCDTGGVTLAQLPHISRAKTIYLGDHLSRHRLALPNDGAKIALRGFTLTPALPRRGGGKGDDYIRQIYLGV